MQTAGSHQWCYQQFNHQFNTIVRQLLVFLEMWEGCCPIFTCATKLLACSQSIKCFDWLIFPTPTTDCNNSFEKLKELTSRSEKSFRLCPSVQSTTAISLRRQGRPKTVSMPNWTSPCLINWTLCHRDWSFFQTICQAAKPKSTEHNRFSPSLNPSDNNSIFISPSSFGCVEVNVRYLWFQF